MLESKNFLVIGSPAANLMARIVNVGACFSFRVTSEALTQATEFQTILDPIRYLPEELEKYTEGKCESTMQRDWSRTKHYMIYGFARSGVLDPVDYKGLRAIATGPTVDYRVVSLCRHPWSSNRVAIMAAGLHGPGTAAAVKLLSSQNAFVDHPLGGVFKVNVPNEAPWEQRYHHLAPHWDTHDYSIEKYTESVDAFTAKYGQMDFWNPKDVSELLETIHSKK